MFDDPKKELEEEVPEGAMLDEAEFEALYNEILEEYGPRNEKTQEPQIRNFANGYGFYVPPKTNITLAVPEDAWPTEPAPEPPKPEPRGNGILILTIVLETLAIAAVLALWVMSFMR